MNDDLVILFLYKILRILTNSHYRENCKFLLIKKNAIFDL